MPTLISTAGEVRPGDFYEDCFHHPCLCVRVDSDEISGISLVDGSSPRICSIAGCAPRRLTLEEALDWKFKGPADAQIPEEARWWNTASEWSAG
jgi:hypothetical protein